MPTIRDVARVARVAPSTVSGVLNRSQRVRPETRERVQSAIETLGYVHQRAGRPPRDQKQHIAVVAGANLHCLPGGAANGSVPAVPIRDHFLVRAMHRAVIDLGHHIHSYAGYRTVDEDAVFRESVESGELDGVILVRETRQDGYLDWLLEQDVPLVVVNREPTPQRPFSHVSMDNFGGGGQAAEFLVAEGHHRLAVLQGDKQYSFNRLRTAGFVAGVERTGDASPRVVELETWEQVPTQCDRLLAAGVTGLFATTDTLAESVLVWARQRGVEVPDRLSLIGFDNHALGVEQTGLRPSSIGYDVGDIAHVALNALSALCQYRGRVGTIAATVRTQLYQHDTTGKAT